MRHLIRGLTLLLLGVMSTPALAQDVLLFSTTRPFPTSGGWETSIYRMNLDGSGMQDLTPGWPATPQPEWSPAVSPDGQWIAFVAEGNLWRMRLDGTDRTFVTGNAMFHTDAWSPDGERLAIARCTLDPNWPGSQTCGIWTVNRDGTALRQLTGTEPETVDGYPTWSPDGTRLVFERFGFSSHPYTYSGSHLFVMNADGSDVRQITFGDHVFDRAPVWVRTSRAPVANAGGDVVVEATGPGGATVTLDGTWSSDPDGDSLTYAWTDDAGTVLGNGARISVELPIGRHSAVLVVDDGNGGTSEDTVEVVVRDTTPPTIASAAPSVTVLWPPNHQLVTIGVSVSATDGVTPSPACRVTHVSSNEPVNGLGDGDTAPDWIVSADLFVQLRAERAGKGNGRVYSVSVACSDETGNAATTVVTVRVPKSQGHK